MCPSDERLTCRRAGSPRRAASAAVALTAITVLSSTATPARADTDEFQGSHRPTASQVVDALGEGKPQLVLLAPQGGVMTVRTRDLQGIATSGSATRAEDVLLDANLAFDKDSADLRPAARARLGQIARVLRDHQAGRVTITGHTDDLGSAEHGLDLSRRRAEAVRQALSDGLAHHQVSVVGRGEAQPLVPNDSEANRARNRRVEISFRVGRR